MVKQKGKLRWRKMGQIRLSLHAKKTVWEKFKDYISFYKYTISHRLLFLVPVKYWDSWMRLWGQGEFHWDVIDDENDDSGTIFEEEG